MLAINKLEKISKYAICLALNNAEQNYVYINGCYGVFEIVPQEIGEIICKKSPDDFREDSKVITYLRRINYLIPTGVDEEHLIQKNCETVRTQEQQYFNFSFIPTYRCNFNCPYCFEKDISKKHPNWLKTTLSKEAVDAIFAFADRLISEGKHFYNIRLFGGEPLLPKNKDIVEYIAQKSQNYGVPIIAITNGYYIDQFADIINKYRLNEFKITIDGTSEIHDQRRAPSNTHKSFNRIINNVLAIVGRNKKVTLRTNVNQENLSNIPKLIAAYSALGFPENPNIHYYFKSTISCFEKPENMVSDLAIMETIGNTVENYPFNSTYFRIYKQIMALIEKNLHLYFRPTYCGACNGNYMFDPNGNVFSCWDIVTESSSLIGRINHTGVALNRQWESWQNRTVDTIETCKSCRYKMFCGGGCAAQAIVVNKDINTAVCDGFIENFNQIAIAIAKNMISKTF